MWCSFGLQGKTISRSFRRLSGYGSMWQNLKLIAVSGAMLTASASGQDGSAPNGQVRQGMTALTACPELAPSDAAQGSAACLTTEMWNFDDLPAVCKGGVAADCEGARSVNSNGNFPINLDPWFTGIRTGVATVEKSDAPAAEIELTLFHGESPCGNVAPIALLGYSERGHPIILTDQGEATISAPKFEIGYRGARSVIDRRTERVVSEYMAAFDMGQYWFYGPDEVYMRHGETCMVAPQEMPGRFTMAPGKCDSTMPKLASRLQTARRADHGVEPATDEDIALAARVMPDAAEQWGERFASKISRIIDSPYLVYNGSVACT